MRTVPRKMFVKKASKKKRAKKLPTHYVYQDGMGEPAYSLNEAFKMVKAKLAKKPRLLRSYRTSRRRSLKNFKTA